MPTVYLKKSLYDEIVKKGEDVTRYVNEVVEESLKEDKRETDWERR